MNSFNISFINETRLTPCLVFMTQVPKIREESVTLPSTTIKTNFMDIYNSKVVESAVYSGLDDDIPLLPNSVNPSQCMTQVFGTWDVSVRLF